MKTKILKSRCPHCRRPMEEPTFIRDRKGRVVGKRFYCGSCDSHWKYDYETRRLRRDD